MRYREIGAALHDYGLQPNIPRLKHALQVTFLYRLTRKGQKCAVLGSGCLGYFAGGRRNSSRWWCALEKTAYQGEGLKRVRVFHKGRFRLSFPAAILRR